MAGRAGRTEGLRHLHGLHATSAAMLLGRWDGMWWHGAGGH
jgi:hypothetical protein